MTHVYATDASQTFSAVGVGTGTLVAGVPLIGDNPAFLFLEGTNANNISVKLEVSPDDGVTWFDYYQSPGVLVVFSITGNERNAFGITNPTQYNTWRCYCISRNQGSCVARIVQG
jgi:hypothetical protein